MLDPQITGLLDEMQAGGAKDFADMTVREAREAVAQLAAMGGVPEQVGEVIDDYVHTPSCDLPVRVYKTPSTAELLPMIVFYHGGGWIAGSSESHDLHCRSLVNVANAMVVSVEYRLAPEHLFPTAPEDCYAALVGIADSAPLWGGDPTRIAVAGDSAGGNLAAVVTHSARDRNGPALSHQLLIYPALDAAGAYPSATENGEGYFLTNRAMEHFYDQYLPDCIDRYDPRVSPLQVHDLSGLPSATIVVAEHDPLRDEGRSYAEHLRSAGVDVELQENPGMIHGFWALMGVLDHTRKSYDATAPRLQAALNTQGARHFTPNG